MEVRQLKDQLSQHSAERRSSSGVDALDSSAAAMARITALVDGINRIVADGINYHKALFEVRDATGRVRRALAAAARKAQVRAVPLPSLFSDVLQNTVKLHCGRWLYI